MTRKKRFEVRTEKNPMQFVVFDKLENRVVVRYGEPNTAAQVCKDLNDNADFLKE